MKCRFECIRRKLNIPFRDLKKTTMNGFYQGFFDFYQKWLNERFNIELKTVFNVDLNTDSKSTTI